MIEGLRRLTTLPVFNDFLASLVLLLGILLALSLTRRAIRRSRLNADIRRRWLVQSRNAALAGLMVGLIVIWGPEVRSLALSLAAVAVAIVVASKEIIVCLLGAFVRTSSRSFDVGDRIEVAGLRGDVIDLSALTTTLLEVPAGHSNRTGRMVVLPNSVFVSSPIVNETPSPDYLLGTLVVPVSRDAGWSQAERVLLEAARKATGFFLDEARLTLAREATHKGLDPSTVDPRVSVRLVDPERVDLLVRFPAPVRHRNRVEQEILRGYLAALSKESPPE